jgi:hypothetical protein
LASDRREIPVRSGFQINNVHMNIIEKRSENRSDEMDGLAAGKRVTGTARGLERCG